MYSSSIDLCRVCGGAGLGEEGNFVFCSQCAEAFHPYCISTSFKLIESMLTYGWR